MAIKVPDNFRPSDYGVEISIPKPVIECEKNDDGSFGLRVGYNFDCISDLAREAAREMYDKMEAELMDELLRLNGYVPERTCDGVFKGTHRGWEPRLFCSECGTELLGKFCHECGAKVVE